MQRHGPALACAQAGNDVGRAAQLIDTRPQCERRRETRILGQHRARPRFGLFGEARVEIPASLRDELQVPPIRLHAVDSVLSAVVSALEHEPAAIQCFGLFEASGGASFVTPSDELLKRRVALRSQIEPERHVARLLLGGAVQLGDPLFVAAVVHGREPFLMHSRCGTTRDEAARNDECQQAAHVVQDPSPSGRSCCTLSGL